MKPYELSFSSLGFGLFSIVILILVQADSADPNLFIAGIGSLIALAGFFLGVFAALRGRDVPPMLRYGGILLSSIGLVNLFLSIVALLKFLEALVLYFILND